MTEISLSEAKQAVCALKSANISLREAEEQHREKIAEAENAEAEYWNIRCEETDQARATVNDILRMKTIGPQNEERLKKARALLDSMSVEAIRLHDEIFDPSYSHVQSIRDNRNEIRDELLKLADPD